MSSDHPIPRNWIFIWFFQSPEHATNITLLKTKARPELVQMRPGLGFLLVRVTDVFALEQQWIFSWANGALVCGMSVVCTNEHGGDTVRQRNMDYVLHWILAFLNGLSLIIVLYDVMCQYLIHLNK